MFLEFSAGEAPTGTVSETVYEKAVRFALHPFYRPSGHRKMSSRDASLHRNVQPDVPKVKLEAAPCALPEKHHNEFTHKNFPETGWRGLIPSQQGGCDEEDFVHKPPYEWKSGEDLFKPKYYSMHIAMLSDNAGVETLLSSFTAILSTPSTVTAANASIFMTSVRMVKNEDNSLHFFSTQRRQGVHDVPCKVSCDQYRSPLFDEGRNTVLAYPSSFKFPNRKVPLDFQPTAHIFYSERVVDIADGVPKWSGHKGQSELLPELTT
ncbi:hypothetical protein ONZ51_g13254 [Trametes cubensis]|uniref:Uncharacterized protein n=1 Tax=Trametes cubensis TaxID=1111947 RepID=A0AAD7TGW4_9APHY|nr:hypothetical protein ONZ51_g13254 [Trametes cubensis]